MQLQQICVMLGAQSCLHALCDHTQVLLHGVVVATGGGPAVPLLVRPFPALFPAGRPVMFTGEMVFPWMFEDFAALRRYKAAADLIALKQDWPNLYRPDVLAANQVPLAAASYVEDMYVDYNLVQETVAGVGSVRHWVTNEYKHSGIRDDGGRIIERLLGMVRDVILIE